MPTTRLLKALSKSLAYFSCWYLSCGGKIRRNLPQFLSSNSVLAFSLRIFVSKSFYKIHKTWRRIFFIIVTRFTAPSPPSYTHTWKGLKCHISEVNEWSWQWKGDTENTVFQMTTLDVLLLHGMKNPSKPVISSSIQFFIWDFLMFSYIKPNFLKTWNTIQAKAENMEPLNLSILLKN